MTSLRSATADPDTRDAPVDAHDRPEIEVSSRRTALAIAALAMGGFAIGTAEFVTMGLLPQIAQGVDATIPEAGHVISAYAVGVVVGAPLIAITSARLPRKGLLLALLLVILVGNVGAAMAPGYGSLLVARFLSGLPHGAYYGVASLVAASLVPRSAQGTAVSRMMLGIPVATLVGVPLGTVLGQHVGWRAAYVVVAFFAVLTFALVAATVPRRPGDRSTNGRTELRAFREPQVWLMMLIGAIGFGGMFAMYSYIAPVVTDVTGQRESLVPVFLLAFGVGSLLGTWVAGPMVDRSASRTMVVGLVSMAAALGLFALLAGLLVPALVLGFLVPFTGSLLVVALQLRLMTVAGAARNLGAALNHASLNVANALGAWSGGLVIAAGWGYRAPSLVGAGLCLGGLLIAGVALRRRSPRAGAGPVRRAVRL